MPQMDDVISVLPRGIQRAMDEAMQDTPVVCLLGPRQCGKSTLARAQAPDRPYLTLDDDNLRQSLKAPRDALAQWLGLPDDRDPRVRWCYGQVVDERKRPRYQALRLTIAPRQDCPCCVNSRRITGFCVPVSL